MSKLGYAAFMAGCMLYLLLVAGCVSDASAQAQPRPSPRYEQDWHRAWQRSVPKKRRHEARRYRWDRAPAPLPRQSPPEDRGRAWHGYRSE